MKKRTRLLFSICFLLSIAPMLAHAQQSGAKLKALIIDGENNHGIWPKTTIMMKDFLEQTGLFEVEIQRTAYTWQGPHYDKSIGLEDIKELLVMYPLENGQITTAVDEPKPDPNFNPDFSQYDVIVTNMGWKASTWPKKVQQSLENYMEQGGGLVVVHAANNSWGDWEEYNGMIGLGGWGGRGKGSGYFVSLDDSGKEHRVEPEKECGSHGPQHQFVVETRSPQHPVMKGLPSKWLHTKDELYAEMCGPAENLTVLATAYSDVDMKGTGNHEPILFTVEYGQGRIFQTVLGHMDYSMECVGFTTTFQRGAEWAATGKVTQQVPDDFPGPNKISARNWDK